MGNEDLDLTVVTFIRFRNWLSARVMDLSDQIRSAELNCDYDMKRLLKTERAEARFILSEYIRTFQPCREGERRVEA